MSRFSVEKLLSHSAVTFCTGILYCCNNFGYRKSFVKGGWGGGVSRFSIEIFLSHSAQKIRRGTI